MCVFKIKKDKNIKELLKFGYEYDKTRKCYFKNRDTDLDADEIIIYEKTRIVFNYMCSETIDDTWVGESELGHFEKNKINDLIEANLIEEVEE